MSHRLKPHFRVIRGTANAVPLVIARSQTYTSKYFILEYPLVAARTVIIAAILKGHGCDYVCDQSRMNISEIIHSLQGLNKLLNYPFSVRSLFNSVSLFSSSFLYTFFSHLFDRQALSCILALILMTSIYQG